MASIGYATVSIVPSARGFGNSLNSQIGPGISGAGRAGGLSLGKSLIAGVAAAGIGVAIGKIVGAAAGFIGDSITEASDLQQSIGGVDAVFGKSAGTIHKWAQGAATDVGLSANAYNGLATVIGSQLKNGGVPLDQIAGKTQSLVKQGADMAAVFGGPVSDAVDAISSALKGERDPIEKYGVSLTQAKIDAEAAALGFTKVGATYDTTAQQAASLSLITKQTSATQGQFAAQTNTLAEQQQILGAQFTNLKATLGTALLPAITTIVSALSAQLGPALIALGPKIQPAAEAISKFITDFGGKIPGIIAYLLPIGQQIVGAFGPAIGILAGAGGAVTPLGIALQALAPVLPQLVTNFASLAGTVATTLAGALVVVAPIITTILSAIVQFVAPLLASKDALGLLAAGFIAFKVASTVFAIMPGLINGFRIAMGLLRATTAIASIAQVAFNVALTANPIGIIVALIAGLVAGLIFFFTQTQLGKDIIANVFKFISEAFQNIATVAQTVWAAVTTAFQTAVDFISGIIQTVVGFISEHWQLLLAIFLGPLGLIIDFIVTNFAQIKAVITTVIGFVVSFIQTQLAVARAVFTTIFNAVKTVVTTVFNAVKGVIQTVIGFIVGYFRTQFAVAKAVVTTVFNAIKTTISTVINGVKTFISTTLEKITGFFRSAFNSANTATSGALGKILTGVRDTIGKVITFFTTLGGKIIKAIGDAGTLLLTVGKNVVQGLIDGIKGAAGAVITAVTGVANGAIQAAKDLFGIHSPSTVFAAIGKFVVDGLVNGVKDNADKVAQVMTDLTAKVKDAFAKSATEIKTANAKILKDQQALTIARARAAEFTKKTSKASRLANAQQQANLRKDIALNKAIIASDKKVATVANQKAITAAIASANTKLQPLANQRDAIAEDLKAATDKLADAIKTRDDFSDNVQKAVTDLGNVANLFKDATDGITKASDSLTTAQADLLTLDGKINDDNAKRQSLMDSLNAAIQTSTTSTSKIARTNALADITEITGQLNDLDTELGDYADQRNTLLGNISQYTAQSNKSVSQTIIESLQTSISQTNAFTAALETLRKQGLDDATYQQIISAGVAGGGLTTAQALLSSGPDAVKQIAALQAQLSAAGGSLGDQTANSLYGAGVRAAQGLVDGLQSQQDKIVAQMEKIADALVTSIKKKLDIHSPSRVLEKVGVFTGQGMANGLWSTENLIAKASEVLMPTTTGWNPLNTALTPGLSAGAGSSNTNFNYTQVGGQGLTAEQELTRASRILRQKRR